MFYYRIGYCYENEDGIYYHLPIEGEVTTDRNVAEQWFENVLRQYTERHWCYKVGNVVEREYDYLCYVKQVHVVCNEPAYIKGDYLIELQCYTHNPNL